MNKKDLAIIVVLFALMMAWPFADRAFFKKPAPPVVETVAEEAAAETPEAIAPADTGAPAAAETAEPPAAAVEAEPEETAPEQLATLENESLRVVVSSRGATVTQAELHEYRQDIAPTSGPVVLRFETARALAYGGIEGLSGSHDFRMTPAGDGRSVVLERTNARGLRLRRTITLAEDYLLRIADELTNTGSEPAAVPAHSLSLGSMENLDGTPQKGLVYLGIDSLSPGGEKVMHWGGKVAGWFKSVQGEKGLGRLPVEIDWPLDRAVDWVAAKNKYFAQILTPEGGADRCLVKAIREQSAAEREDPGFRPKNAVVSSLSAAVVFPETEIAPGKTAARSVQYYVGPKKYSELTRFGLHQVDVMEFGMWAPIGKILLWTMNWIHDVLWPHNYGIAIILLTILVRIVFWPLTHKSTESMKKMQEVQPLVNAAREKHKDNPQKQQQEIMAIYRENKVNPLGGCLPTLIQIPVFIALFVVLRSAIELRFAPFLWIRDLSQPENLLAGVLPIPINILPIFMAVTMAWQQKLTPTAGGDPAQQKMMMFMPVMMLVLFYNFAAGLVLYWSTNQCLMIAQQLRMHRKSKVQSPKSKGG